MAKNKTAAERNRDDDFAGVMAGLEDALEIAEGRADPAAYRVHAPEEVDVRAIRKAQGLTQEAFARRYGFSPPAVRDWEQGRRRPEASARILLRVIETNPKAVEAALAAGR